jgi:hypothetical protein
MAGVNVRSGWYYAMAKQLGLCPRRSVAMTQDRQAQEEVLF